MKSTHEAAPGSGECNGVAPVGTDKRSSSPGPDPMSLLSGGITELIDALRELVGARAQQVRISIQRVIIRAALSVMLLLGWAAVAFLGAVFLGLAIARGLGDATGRPWVGYLAAALLLLGVSGSGIFLLSRQATRRSAARTAQPGTRGNRSPHEAP